MQLTDSEYVVMSLRIHDVQHTAWDSGRVEGLGHQAFQVVAAHLFPGRPDDVLAFITVACAVEPANTNKASATGPAWRTSYRQEPEARRPSPGFLSCLLQASPGDEGDRCGQGDLAAASFRLLLPGGRLRLPGF